MITVTYIIIYIIYAILATGFKVPIPAIVGEVLEFAFLPLITLAIDFIYVCNMKLTPEEAERVRRALDENAARRKEVSELRSLIVKKNYFESQAANSKTVIGQCYNKSKAAEAEAEILSRIGK